GRRTRCPASCCARLDLRAFRGASRSFPSSHLHRRWVWTRPRRWPNGPDSRAVPSCDIVPREASSLGRRAATTAFALLSRRTANPEEETHGEPDTSRTDRDESEPLPDLRERARADRLSADLSRRHHAARRCRAGAEGSRFLAQ